MRTGLRARPAAMGTIAPGKRTGRTACAVVPAPALLLLAVALLVAAAPGAWAQASPDATGRAQTGAVAGPGVDTGAAAADTAGRAEPLPDELQGVGITEHLGARVPLDLEFTDEDGRTVRLGDFFQGRRPVIFNLAYYTCPMLCTLVLNGVVESANQLDWTLGDQFENVTVSINPAETSSLARAKKENYLHSYKKPEAAAHWHFLVGRQENITRLADAVGFGYRYDPVGKQFVHTAVTMVLTPDGRVSRYLYGVDYPPQTMRLALLEAGQGKLGTTLDKVILYCYHYDASAGRYSLVAIRVMQIGGLLTVGVLGVLLLALHLGGRRRHARTLCLVPAMLFALAGQAAAQARPEFWLPARASTDASRVDWLFNFILIICVFFFLLVVGLMVLFVVRYRRREGRESEPTRTHNLPLELTWTIIPFVLLMIIFAFGFKTYLGMSTPPRNAIPIAVTGQKWTWQFTYPNGYTDGVLHVPVNVPVALTLTSEDVIHSLYIPNFRIKKDAVPGRYSSEWFQADQPGTYPIYCTQYCGRGHSSMLTTVVVHEPGGYEKWLAGASDVTDKLPPAQAGELIFKSRGCPSCHTTDGRANVGPTLKGVFGSQVSLRGGTTVLADENYVHESILDPGAKVVNGFDPVMPTFRGRIKDKEITDIIEYLKTLK